MNNGFLGLLMKEIPLTRGLFAKVDDEDEKIVTQFKWKADKGCRTYYAVRTQHNYNKGIDKKKTISMHRFILFNHGIKIENFDIDHINGDGLDNQKSNLRICTRQENARNQKGKSAERFHNPFKGVHWEKCNSKYLAHIWYGGKQIRLGLFRNPIEAARVYNAAAIYYFREFACLNEI